MNENQRQQCEMLRSLESEEATDYLMATYQIDSQNFGDAFLLLPHRSWKQPDQIRLARHFFRKIPFANSRPYEAFAQFMSLPILVGLLLEFVPKTKARVGLFKYHAEPVLRRKVSNKQESLLVDQFIAEIDSKAQCEQLGDK